MFTEKRGCREICWPGSARISAAADLHKHRDLPLGSDAHNYGHSLRYSKLEVFLNFLHSALKVHWNVYSHISPKD